MQGNLAKALSEGTDAAGGFTVPDPIAMQIVEYIQANSVAINDMDKTLRMTSDTLLVPKLTAGSTVRRTGENTTITGADVGFGQLTMSAFKFTALMSVSTELLEDSQNNMAGVITSQFSKDLTLATDFDILAGGGTTTFTGLSAGVAATNTFSSGTLSWTKIVSGADKVLAGNHPLPDRLYTNPTNVTRLALLTDSSARPIFNMETAGSPLLRNGVVGMVYAQQVKPTTQITSTILIGGVAGRMGFYSMRRAMQFNRFYDISKDDWIYQANMRHGFVVKHSNSFYLATSVA